MKKRKFNKILIIGSGAIKIGQAGEFDYSGTQAIKALKEEGIKSILINPNIATIQTSDNFADKVYFLPITEHFVQEVIKKEKPEGILLGFGGQTALNVGLKLWESGFLEKNCVEVLGTPAETIQKTEDRDLFANEIRGIGLKTPVSEAVNSVEGALDAAERIGFPVMVRIAYALGGLGSGVVETRSELEEKARKGLTHADQILIEECLSGWKEVEYEVVRDLHNNCIVVCSMENFDPMGIHTGESVVVAPIQTLSAKENFMLRSISIKTIRHLGIVGECNIQFTFDPSSCDYRIIEVNPRLSRSSALASKATGYPLAFIASKLSLGYSITDLENIVTKETSACFEPALDYLVVKYPRWDLEKFRHVSNNLGSEMKSIGEVMSIGRSFEEVIQKAIRMLDIGAEGFSSTNFQFNDLDQALKRPTDKRIFAISKAFSLGYSVEDIHNLSKIDRWFLYKLQNIFNIESQIKRNSLSTLDISLLKEAKQSGFSDLQIANLLSVAENIIRSKRKEAGIIPVVKQIDTLAGEFPAKTNYLYLTYNGSFNDLEFDDSNQVAVLGSGSYRIGCSVEFDWCCVNSNNCLRDMGYKTIMINYNPETVSTDYDNCDKLYFEELSFERVMDIVEKENPLGVIVSMGGQIPNNLAMPLSKEGVNILGTPPEMIDNAEDRDKFSTLLDQLDIDQPEWEELNSSKAAAEFAEKVEYPVLIRPSYVLSGAAMSVALNENELNSYLQKSSNINSEHPVVISKFITDAKEIDIDAVAKDGNLCAYAVSGHVENAGVHSGDATLVLPPQRTYLETMRQVKITATKIAKALKITGPFNIQFLAKDNLVMVIECNLRASRSFPFVSKIVKHNFIKMATLAIMDKPFEKLNGSTFDLNYVGVKASEFSFTRLKGSDPIQTVEMTSTGEVATLGDNFNEAFLKSLLSVGFKIPQKNILISSGPIASKLSLLKSIVSLDKMGYNFYATRGTAEFLKENGIKATVLRWPLEEDDDNCLEYIATGKIDLVINIPKNSDKTELDNDYYIRRKAVDYGVPLITNLQFAKRFVETISSTTLDDLKIKSWDEYIQNN